MPPHLPKRGDRRLGKRNGLTMDLASEPALKGIGLLLVQMDDPRKEQACAKVNQARQWLQRLQLHVLTRAASLG
jgi:hypothetical protein